MVVKWKYCICRETRYILLSIKRRVQKIKMKSKKKKVLIILEAIVLLVSPVFAQTWRVDNRL